MQQFIHYSALRRAELSTSRLRLKLKRSWTHFAYWEKVDAPLTFFLLIHRIFKNNNGTNKKNQKIVL